MSFITEFLKTSAEKKDKDHTVRSAFLAGTGVGGGAALAYKKLKQIREERSKA